jgi:hypothetical protein
MFLARRQNRRRRPASGDSAVEAESLLAVYFLLPLEVPLSIPDKSIILRQEKPLPGPGFEDDYLTVEWDDQEGLVSCRVSCCFHQITTTEGDAAQFAAFEAARVAFPSPQNGAASTEGPSLPAVVTVAEVAVRLTEHSEDAVNRALGEAIEFVAGVQRTYGALASEPMAIMTRARLPLLVPHAVREVIPGAHPAEWPDMAELDIVMPRAPRAAEYMSAPSAERPAAYSLEDLATAMGPVLGGPFRHVHESWRNAMVAFSQGDFAVAAILAGMTCEQTIRALLLCLLWESDVDAVDAARVLYENSGRTKNVRALLTELMQRLPATGEPDDAARDTARSVLELRNRILHRAYQPTEAEARTAMDQCAQFATWTREATLGNLYRYAVTAAMSVSKPKLGADPAARLGQALTSNLWPTRPCDNVRNYHFEIERHLSGNEAMRERRVRDLPDVTWESVSLVYPDGTTRWFCLDEANKLAYVAKAPATLRGRDRRLLRDQSERTAVVIDEYGHRPTIVSKWRHIELEPLAKEPYLYSWYKISPLDQARRHASCPTPHIPADSPPGAAC